MTERPGLPIDDQELGRIRAQAMDFATVGLYRYKFTGEIVFMDHVVLRMLDLQDTYPDPAALIGKDIGELFVHMLPPGSHRRVVRERGEVKDFEYHYTTLSGQERWSSHSAYVVRDQNTGEESIQVLCKDITDLRRAARATEASEARYRGLAEQSPLGIAVVTSAPPGVAFANRAIADLLGMTREEVVAADLDRLLECVYQPDREQMRARYTQRMMGAAPPSTYEFRILRGGAVVWVSISVQPITFDDAPALQVTLTDVTERRQAEQAHLREDARAHHRQKLESLGLLSGGIAHDFNNLLSVILANAQLAQRQLPAVSRARGNLRDVVEAAQRAAELCRQLLAYSGVAPLVRESFSLTELVRTTWKLFEVTVSKRAELRLELAEALPAVVGEPSQIRQILMNLLTNASDAVAGGGTVVLRTGLVDCSQEQLEVMRVASPNAKAGQYLFVEVADDGCGMSDEMVGKVFDPFFTTKAEGRGLGLASVIGIVRSHDGALSVDSAPGRGTTMRVLLPAATRAPEAASTDQTARPPWRSAGTVLLADDEDGVRRSLAEVLHSVGFEVVTASDGCEALDRFRGHHGAVRALVFDLTMPGKDGLAAAREIRGVAPQVPVLFISGHAAAYAREVEALCAARLLYKPFRIEEFLDQLRALLGEQ